MRIEMDLDRGEGGKKTNNNNNIQPFINFNFMVLRDVMLCNLVDR
jgi:hypothetical protein